MGAVSRFEKRSRYLRFFSRERMEGTGTERLMLLMVMYLRRFSRRKEVRMGPVRLVTALRVRTMR